MAAPTKFSYRRLRRILTHIRNGGTKRGAAAAGRIDEVTLYRWEHGNVKFARALKEAQDRSLKSDLKRLDRFVRAGNLKALFYRLNVVHGLAQKVVVEQTGTVKHEHSHEVKEAENILSRVKPEGRREIIRAFNQYRNDPN